MFSYLKITWCYEIQLKCIWVMFRKKVFESMQDIQIQPSKTFTTFVSVGCLMPWMTMDFVTGTSNWLSAKSGLSLWMSLRPKWMQKECWFCWPVMLGNIIGLPGKWSAGVTVVNTNYKTCMESPYCLNREVMYWQVLILATYKGTISNQFTVWTRWWGLPQCSLMSIQKPIQMLSQRLYTC